LQETYGYGITLVAVCQTMTSQWVHLATSSHTQSEEDSC